MVFFTSCEVANDLEEFDPLFSLPAETAIKDESTAELALTGMYAILQQRDIQGNPWHAGIANSLGGVNTGGAFFFVGAEEASYLANNPITDGVTLSTIYSGQYVMINRANWVIDGVEKLTDDDFINNNRRLEIIGEAKTMRALGHFHLLRLFGQFYDTNSSLGVNVRQEPATDAIPQPRVSVADTYAAILADLDEGISKGPNSRPKFYASSTFAKGLKAKVLLYMGDYAQAATIAKDVIDNSGPNFALTPTFVELFDHTSLDPLDKSESLFNVYSDDNEGLGMGTFWGLFWGVSDWYYDLGELGTMTVGSQVINHDGPRTPFMKTGEYQIPGFGINGNMKFKQPSGPQAQFETFYYLRMAEMHLIYAEASARSSNSVPADALASLNAVRIRVGATTTGGDGFETYPASISYDQFLEAVRIEKLMELGGEWGEDWYDLVRYDYADGFGTGFQVSDTKATATNSDKFIMPIPAASIQASNGVVEQNPSY